MKKVTKRELVERYEGKALKILQGYLDRGRQSKANDEKNFAERVKKSPSTFTLDFGIMIAIEVGWYDVLENLLSVDLSTYKHLKSDSTCEHPLVGPAFTMLDLPPASGGGERGGYVNAALLYAIVSGRVEAVRILANHMDLNIGDVAGEPLLHYVYLSKDQDARKEILSIVLHKLHPSRINVRKAAENGDLESMKYLVEKMHHQRQRYFTTGPAGRAALKNGHEHIARWMVENPDLIDLTRDMGYLVEAAVETKNFGMVEYLSKHSPSLLIHQLGYYAASILWKFLKEVDRPELFAKFVPSCPKGYSL